MTDRNFQHLTEQLLTEKITTTEFLNVLESWGDYSDDLLAALEAQRARENWLGVSRLVTAVMWVPFRKFTPFICDLLDHHRRDGYMETLADLLVDLYDERSVPSILGALDYYVWGDDSRHFNRKLVEALDRIDTPEAVEGIRLAARSPHELIREEAGEILQRRRDG